VWSAVAAELADPALAAEVQRRAAARAANRRDWNADAAGYRAHLARLARVEASILARYRRGAVTDAALDQELAAIARERAAVSGQLEAASRASAAGAEDLELDPGAWLAAICRLAADATPAEQQRVVRAIVQPGSVTFDGARVRLTLLVEAGSRAEPAGAAARLAVAPGCRTHHETAVQIRLVA